MRDEPIKPWNEIINVPCALSAIKHAKEKNMGLAEWVAGILVHLACEYPEFGTFTINDCYTLAEQIRQAAIVEARRQVTELENMSV